MRRRRQLSNRILASVVVILTASTLVGFALSTLGQRAQLESEYQKRALAIAQTFAAMPTIQQALLHEAGPSAGGVIQHLAQQVRRKTGATYIVVIDRKGVRWSHPHTALIGQTITEPVVALDGRNHLGVDHGLLGPSASARVPIDAGGRIIGEVSAGIREQLVFDQLLHDLPGALLYFAVALGIGVVASVTLARRLKRSTFGLELEEIAALVQEREAMLHGIRDGVITLDREGRVTLVNDEAKRLLGLESAQGRRIEEFVPPGRLRDLLVDREGTDDQVVLTDDHVLVINRMGVVRNGRELGAVITLRDRTELEALLRELDGVDALTDALRAQQHEFSNRMHTVAGLIELGDHDGAVRYAIDVSDASGGLAEVIREQIERPEIAAMLLAKTTVAAERSVSLKLTPESRLTQTSVSTQTLLTIIGNLIDNAIEAAADGPSPAWVTVHLCSETDGISITVGDSGPGVPPGIQNQVFSDGFSTKPVLSERHRGLGLALVHRLVRREGGRVWIDPAQPAVFRVLLPTPGAVPPASDAEQPPRTFA